MFLELLFLHYFTHVPWKLFRHSYPPLLTGSVCKKPVMMLLLTVAFTQTVTTIDQFDASNNAVNTWNLLTYGDKWKKTFTCHMWGVLFLVRKVLFGTFVYLIIRNILFSINSCWVAVIQGIYSLQYNKLAMCVSLSCGSQERGLKLSPEPYHIVGTSQELIFFYCSFYRFWGLP